MGKIIIVILGVSAFLIYAGINAIMVCNIMDNYKSSIDYFNSVLKDEKINFLGKIVFIILNLLFPFAVFLSAFVSLSFFFDEGGYTKLKEWFRRVFAKK